MESQPLSILPPKIQKATWYSTIHDDSVPVVTIPTIPKHRNDIDSDKSFVMRKGRLHRNDPSNARDKSEEEQL